jgi:hypothetical protein
MTPNLTPLNDDTMLPSHVARRSGILCFTGLRSAKEGVKFMQKMRPRHSKKECVGRALERDIYQYFSAPFLGLLISPKLRTCPLRFGTFAVSDINCLLGSPMR